MTAKQDPAVILSSPSVPVEIVRAVGLRPVIALGSSDPTPVSDAHVEPGVFPRRLLHLMDAALSGRLSEAACIVLPRTSDVDYKCFLYLREFVRRGVVAGLPPVILYDLLQSQGSGVREYDVQRTRALCEALAAICGRTPSAEDIRHEITRANAARHAARVLLALRRGTPRVTGEEVFPLLAGFWQMDPDRYVADATAAMRMIAMHAPLAGPRVLLIGVPVDSPALHQAIESHGAIVCAESGAFGSGVAGDDVRVDDDPLAALADKYRVDTIGARTPVDLLTQWIGHRLEDVDAVVMSLPPEDAVFGWDYPAVREVLDGRGVPHVVLRGDPYGPLASSEHARLGAMVAAASRLQEARSG